MGSFREGPLMKGIKSLQRIFIVAAFGLWATGAALAQLPGEGWTRLGLLAGNVTAVGLSPAYASDTTIYVGLADSGLWRSTNRGATWRHIIWTESTPNVPNSATVTAIAFDPSYHYGSGNGKPMYVGTQDGQVYGSTNDFASISYDHTFTDAAGTAAVPVTCMVCPAAGPYATWVFAGTSGGGIFYSYAYGYWDRSSSSTTFNDCRALAAGPAGQIFSACNVSGAPPVYQFTSLDWVSKGPTGWSSVVPTALHVASANANDLWLGTAQYGIWRSTDDASTWTAGCDAGNPLSIPRCPTASEP